MNIGGMGLCAGASVAFPLSWFHQSVGATDPVFVSSVSNETWV